jgi:hypothetical protein
MGHYAKVDVNNKVVQVIVAEPEFFDNHVDDEPCQWLKTSYNIRGGVYYDPETNQPAEDQAAAIGDDEGRLRKNYAGIGCTYDASRNAFIAPQPYPSWTLNEDTCIWEAPVPMPEDVAVYYWDESAGNWVVEDTPPE